MKSFGFQLFYNNRNAPVIRFMKSVNKHNVLFSMCSTTDKQTKKICKYFTGNFNKFNYFTQIIGPINPRRSWEGAQSPNIHQAPLKIRIVYNPGMRGGERLFFEENVLSLPEFSVKLSTKIEISKQHVDGYTVK